jgi:hypothetical protein
MKSLPRGFSIGSVILSLASVALAADPMPPPPAETSETPVKDAAKPSASMNKNVSAFVAVGYGYGYSTGFGIGGRYQFTVVPEGFITSPKIRDELGIEAGLDYFHLGWTANYGIGNYSWSYNEFTPVVGVVWNVWFNDKLAIYPKIDLGYHIGSISASYNGQAVDTTGVSFSALYFQGTGGIIYRVSDAVGLRAEAGWSSLRLGASIAL